MLPTELLTTRAIGTGWVAISPSPRPRTPLVIISMLFMFTVHCARSGLDKNIVSTTAPERAVLSVLSLGVALRTDESGRSEAAETFIFLASISLAFAGHVVLFWLWLPRRGRRTAPVDREMQRKMCEMLGISALKGYQVEALEVVCLNKRDTLVCVPTGSRNSACFEVGLIRTVIDHVTVSERAA